MSLDKSGTSSQPEISYKGTVNFNIRKELGAGAVGTVHLVVHKQTQELYALKQVSKIQASQVSVGISISFILWLSFPQKTLKIYLYLSCVP